MELLGIVVVAPIWGMVSARLFLQACAAASSFVVAAIGFVWGRVRRSNTIIMMAVSIFAFSLFATLLFVGFWLLAYVMPFGRSQPEKIVY
jgi:hypothetical protein